MNKAIGYVRVSTEEQASEGVSIDAQLEKIRAYGTLKDLEFVDIVTDAGVSAGKPLAERPGGRKVFDAARKGKAQSVVVVKLDKAFRDAADCLTTTREWDKRGVAFHILDMGGTSIDTSTAMGRMFLTMAAGFAELERNLIRERTAAAMAHKRAKGERVSRYAPFGYDFGPDGMLSENPTEQAVIADIRRLRQNSETLRAIAEELTRREIPTKQGNTEWTHQAVASILKRSRPAA